MPTKTERILSYLPRTFRALPRPSVLHSLVDAFGAELLKGENSLAAVMLSHWVDHADRGAELIDDLARIGALYGLAPRPDESVEEFRTHLKRYIRTFLEGTVTVQGALRITAETLALHIADDYARMDCWWNRPTEILTTRRELGADAARLVLGLTEAVAEGGAPAMAEVRSHADLSAGVDLRGAGHLHLAVDGAPAVSVDLTASAGDPAAVHLDELRDAINADLGLSLADHDGRHLRLTSPTLGAAGRLEILDGPADAAPLLFDLPPRRYLGSDAAPARLSSRESHAGPIDLSRERYLRLFIDGAHLAEIDCAGADPAATSLDEVRDNINAAFGFALASHEESRLILTSPTLGLGSRIEVLGPAAQDARVRLLGGVPPLTLGSDAATARLVGAVDLSLGVDLSQAANLALRIDGGAPMIINCAGPDPARTLLPEVVAAINTALGQEVASHNSRRLILASPTSGAAASLEIAQADAGDASEVLLGLKPRLFQGQGARQAQIIGRVELSAGVDLAALHQLHLAVDDAPPVLINLRATAADRRSVSLAELVTAINQALAAPVAAHDGHRLLLTSPTSGTASRLAVIAMEEDHPRRFVTRTPILDEAALALFGFIAKEAQGTPAGQARLTGNIDLSRGVDLRNGRFLRLAIDAAPPVEVDCAGPRPRASTLAEITAAINTALGADIASHDDRNLTLAAPSNGAESRVRVLPSQALDAREVLLGLPETTARGSNATGVTFIGTVNLTNGVDLPPQAFVNIGIDGDPPIAVSLTGENAAHKNLNQLMLAINLALGKNLARHDGRYLSLASPSVGAIARLEFAAAPGIDVTTQIFGITPPRDYQGQDAHPASLQGLNNLPAGVDLRVQRFLRLAIDGQASRDLDCSLDAADPAAATLDEIVAAINNQAGAAVATHEGARLTLTSPTNGAASRLVLTTAKAGDAALKLLGSGVEEAQGLAGAAAILTGEVDLIAGADLSRRGLLRLAVDGGRPEDIDVAGAAPGRTFGDEVVAAINRVFSGLASLTDEDRLQLTSPTSGEGSRVSLLPLRHLEVVEYPPAPRATSALLHFGEALNIDNQGAAEVFAEARFHTSQGVAGPGLADVAAGWRLVLRVVLNADDGARVWRDADGKVRAERILADGSRLPIAAERIFLDGEQASILRLPRGRNRWLFLNCQGHRYNVARFDQGRFTGGLCRTRGIFNLSRFFQLTGGPLAAVFAWPPGQDPEPATHLSLSWLEHQPGAFRVNLPADLPPRFGARFNEARFALPGAAPEFYPFSVTEPAEDPDYLPARLNASSQLVKAQVVPNVPLGWQPVAMPFRKARALTLGGSNQAARIYLAEEGIQGFLEIEAKVPGAAGNSIRIAARKSGPALFDVSVEFEGGRFENARTIVLGDPLPALTSDLLKPSAVGLLQARAAGVKVKVTRDRT
ncbi:hypothetical protein [Geoalkalibacter halelectricus]|uniref:Uncharacterized protein n=1 Tax=Geoalkalibacter halelectricus TaxID=2847045 RepID=A0ABY5ZQ08_9BACT|nr:hypothetical protein [Geoalkalibacter halelectricus]MDO3379159.1 hypothetical protein [Geoalkalibacter halelectricus]UWZ80919.1 hypothetical protein L9S41_05815 [Geoalkalibacter halelectricus]